MTPAIDLRTGRAFGDHGTADQAIRWALDHEGLEADAFLRAWREGDLEEWPEFYFWLARRERGAPEPTFADRQMARVWWDAAPAGERRAMAEIVRAES